jgi:tetratricopeptide (TPR) repeat protein
MQDFDGAMECYQLALKYNQWSVPAMQGIACILRTKDAFPQAVEYLRTILKVDPANGDVWGSLGKSKACNLRTTVLTYLRSLLPDDGRPAAGLLSLPAGTLPSVRSKGNIHRLPAALARTNDLTGA